MLLRMQVPRAGRLPRRLSLQDSGDELLLRRWDHQRNLAQLQLTPADVTMGSGKKVFWLCEGCASCGRQHSWQAAVSKRSMWGGPAFHPGSPVMTEHTLSKQGSGQQAAHVPLPSAQHGKLHS